jgi:hypothetical protein
MSTTSRPGEIFAAVGQARGPTASTSRIPRATHADRIGIIPRHIITILMNNLVYEGIGPTYNESRLRDGGSSPVGPAFAVSGLSSPLPPQSQFDLDTHASRSLGRRRALRLRARTDTDPSTS